MILCQISDLHIKRDRKFAYGKVDTAGALQRCVERINALEPRPDWVVATGDLVDSGALEEYQALRPLLDRLAMPYALLAGNHDRRDTLRQVFADHDYLHGHTEFIQYALDVGEVRLIALDTLQPGSSGGMLCRARLDWLDALLAASAGRPVVLAMHHPPFQTGIAHMDAIGLDPDAAAELARRVAAWPNVERIVCGHLHRPIQARFAGTLACTSPAPAHQVALDLRADGPSAYVLEPGGFMLHLWRPGQGLVSHQACIDPAEGPHPFFDEGGSLID
ncbi:phosphodiesterase [Chromobacterium sphagni]|uniref:Phosphodiesterase n=1 Tax=Chromobacterium sphagni TaxID=1903179 RepID=A0A1S1X1H3_9NEIS|nr:phosphodiesterase [Chromobacterium sphagni]OHX13372.1 phosphodiesterase [Chromobacterium sphagni]